VLADPNTSGMQFCCTEAARRLTPLFSESAPMSTQNLSIMTIPKSLELMVELRFSIVHIVKIEAFEAQPSTYATAGNF